MNIHKHLSGLAVFFIILTTTVFIHEYMTLPFRVVPRGKVAVSSRPLPRPTIEAARPVNYAVRLVSLDFINGQSHATIILRRESGQPVPQKVWVTTFFFAPDEAPGRGWTSATEILRPFDAGDHVELTASASCHWCEFPESPRAGYFARVYVSADYPDNSRPLDVQFDRDITTAVPVVVQAERKERPVLEQIERKSHR